ncbi:hypothetical protein M5K25_020706 [Dendrobium thyrsiflorum]|uniref:Uncharacterized protein n=1 Tax=Dendrobium thyrsiflorum TaxID=117978 RepID=A0ABD0UHZ2_DENTH
MVSVISCRVSPSYDQRNLELYPFNGSLQKGFLMVRSRSYMTQLMSDAHSRQARSTEAEEDKYLQMFHKLKPQLFRGAIELQPA